jgi:hypothetical protein
MNFLILAQSPTTARALGAWLELLGEPPLEVDKDRISDSRCLLQSGDGADNPSVLFDKVANLLRNKLDGLDKRLTVLVDTVHFGQLDPTGGRWDASVAMWILAFPEINWHFGVIRPPSAPVQEDIKQLQKTKDAHSLSALFQAQQDPLFDGTGLREHVRDITREAEGSTLAPYLPKRSRCAVAIDDEVTYSYFNALTAYRSGFRTYVIRRYKEAEALLADRTSTEGMIEITFEDIFLNFPDKTESNIHLSKLYCRETGRAKYLPGLENSRYRVFVSSSQTVTMRDGQRELNRSFIKSGAGADCAREVQKPLSGIFDLKNKARFEQKLKWVSDEGKTMHGVAENFHWPPPKSLMEGGEVTGHGAPGRLLQIAEFLINRAEKILSEGATSVHEAVTGAVLATDALELLGDRTPTTATQALDLKHNLEVTAECQFSGVEYHIEIQDRLDEIKKESEVLAGWFHPDQKKSAAWNAEMHIVNRIVRILRNYNQFDEEAICMHRVRDLHNHLWTRQKPPIIRTVLFWLASYASWLMASFGNFVLSLAACVVGLGALHVWLEIADPTWDDLPARGTILRPIVQGMFKVFPFFVGANDLEGDSWGVSLILGLAALLGLIHLGIFLSFLYSVISRKS